MTGCVRMVMRMADVKIRMEKNMVKWSNYYQNNSNNNNNLILIIIIIIIITITRKYEIYLKF